MMIRSISVAAVAAAIGLACCAQSGAGPSTPDLTGIAHVAIRVGDLERSRAFFHKLGFEEAFAMDQGGAPTEAFVKVNDRQFIELYPRRDAAGAVGFMHICFEAADISGVHENYVDHGLAPTAVKRAGAGNLLFTMQGPEQPGSSSDLRGAATQNIEYTQYMPGSRHTLDRGQHLGSERIAERIVAVGIPFSDPAVAEDFYQQKLSFRHGGLSSETGNEVLTLPGSPDQQVAFLSAGTGASPNALPFQLIFEVPNLRHAASRLQKLGLKGARSGKTLTVEDPDGDRIVFVERR